MILAFNIREREGVFVEMFYFRNLKTRLKAAFLTKNINNLFSKTAGGCMADSMICSRGRLRKRFKDGFMPYMPAGSFRPAESGIP